MTIYAALSDPSDGRLPAALEAQLSGSYYKVADGEYLISISGMTTKQLAERIGVNSGMLGRVMLLHVDNWWGWHDKDIWEWLTAKTQPSMDGQGSDKR